MQHSVSLHLHQKLNFEDTNNYLNCIKNDSFTSFCFDSKSLLSSSIS